VTHGIAIVSAIMLPLLLLPPNLPTRSFIRPQHVPVFGEGEPQREKAARNTAPEYQYGSKSMNAAFAALNDVKRAYFGSEHFACIMRLLGYGGLALCVDEMLKIVSNALTGTLTPYLASLQDGMPKVRRRHQCTVEHDRSHL